MQGNYICNLLVPTKELRITGSVEQLGLQQINSYSNNCLAIVSKKICHIICLSDVECAIFENVGYANRTAFQVAFVYKDVRIEPYLIKQIQFDQINAIQDYLQEKHIFYIEDTDSQQWTKVKQNLNARREDFEEFVRRGGWADMYGLMGNDESEQYDQDDSSDAYTAQEDSYDDDESDEYDDSYVSSESGYDTESTGSVFDWDAESSN